MYLNVTHINNFLTTGCYILFVKILTKYSKKAFLVFIRFVVCFACYTKVILKSAHFPCVYSQISCRNWTQLIVTVATCLFLSASVIVNHTQYISHCSECVKILDCFWSAVHCRELGHHFLSKWDTDKCTHITCGNSWDLYALWFWV